MKVSTRRKIAIGLKELKDPQSKTSRRIAALVEKQNNDPAWQKEQERFENSTHITAEDMAVYIGPLKDS